MVQSFPDELRQPFTSATTAESQIVLPSTSVVVTEVEGKVELLVEVEDITQNQEDVVAEEPAAENTANDTLLPRRNRHRRKRNRPLAPLDEARRILSQIETQRVAADAARARAHELLAHNIMPIVDVAHLGRLTDVAERYLEFLMAPMNNSQ